MGALELHELFGAKLDERVTEVVLGWQIRDDGAWMCDGFDTGWRSSVNTLGLPAWSPSTNIEHALHILAKIRESFDVQVTTNGSFTGDCTVCVSGTEDGRIEVTAAAPIAICIAAMRTFGAEINEVARGQA